MYQENAAPRGHPPRLVFGGAIGTDRGIVGLLHLPGDDAVLDVHLPRTRPGAVHPPVGGPDHLVVAPAVAVEDIAGAPAAAKDGPAVVRLRPAGDISAQLQQRLRRRVPPTHHHHCGAWQYAATWLCGELFVSHGNRGIEGRDASDGITASAIMGVTKLVARMRLAVCRPPADSSRSARR